MNRKLALLMLLSMMPLCAYSMERAYGDCSSGGVQVNIPAAGLSTTNTGTPTYWQQSFPSCTVTVYLAGITSLSITSITRTSNVVTATLNGTFPSYGVNATVSVTGNSAGFNGGFTVTGVPASNQVTWNQSGSNTTSSGGTAAFQAAIYGDNNLTPLGNPLTSDSTGHWFFYAPFGRYDIARSGISTFGDVEVCDPVGPNSDNCGGGQIFTSIYNVRSYNATGGGAVDDSTAEQAAINAAHAAGGGTVFYPHGTYLTNSGLTLYSNISIQCSDQGTIIETPSNATSPLFNGNNISNVRITECQLNGQATGSSSSSNAVLIQFQCSSNIWIEGNYIHDSGFNLGIDTNSPTCVTSSNQIFIDHNIFGPSHVTGLGCGGAPCDGNLQFGDGAFNLMVTHNFAQDNLTGQLIYDCDGCVNSTIKDNIAVGLGTNMVSACYQVEATSHDVTDDLLQGNWCINIAGTQAGIFLAASGSRTLSRINVSGNHVINSGRGEELTNFNGTSGSVISDVTFSNESLINTGSPSGAALVIWNHVSGATFGQTVVSNMFVDNCGTGDGTGCVVISGAGNGTGPSVQINGASINNVPVSSFPIFQTTVSVTAWGQLNLSGITWTGGAAFSCSTSSPVSPAPTNILESVVGQVDFTYTCIPAGASGTIGVAIPSGLWQVTANAVPAVGNTFTMISVSDIALGMGGFPSTGFATPVTVLSNTNVNNGQNATLVPTGVIGTAFGQVNYAYTNWTGSAPIYIYFHFLGRSPVANT